ncbi:MAG: RNA methyltransferase [Verrucomicrobia bacterium]|nr:RNA methyltransferase [Verrucomicrobiota bacterium]
MNLDNVRVVLVGPLYGGNVGSVCRAMANMGLSDLAIVPERSLNMDEARMMACHATDILESRSTHTTLKEAVEDCGVVMGTSARTGLYRQHAKTPREWAPTVLADTSRGRVALVFGREDKGLTNEELSVCSRIIQIPTSDSYTSLNLSQAVMVCCYEIFVAADLYEPPIEKSPLAPTAFRERMFDIWRALLLMIGFMGDDKCDHMMQGFRRVMGRGAVTEDDVRIMIGVARQAEWAAEHLQESLKAEGDKGEKAEQ